MSTERSDKTSVIFKKLEKVGEPYMLEDKKFQKYRVFKTPYIYNKIDCSWQSFADPYYVSLEIKPTKEYMEERYKILEDLVSQYMEADIGYREFEEGVEKWYKEHRKNTEKKLSFKSFNLEAAKSGKPVCTRDGRKARIICWNIKDKDNPIAAAVSVGKCESVYLYTNKGEYNKGKEDELDLMMFPEKRNGWAVIKRSDIYETEEQAKEVLLNSRVGAMIRNIEWEE